MKHLFSNGRIQLIVAVSLANLSLPVLQAKSRCPGGAASVTPRFVQRALIVIPVNINRKGPFDFMVDTGSQVTVIDPTLASELDLKSQGTVGLVTVASYVHASLAVLDTLEAASHVVEKPAVVVQDLGQIQAADPRIRGVLGENFLAHFDLLIDYPHKLLCLDETGVMRESVRGERISLVAPEHPESEVSFTDRLVISVHLSGTGTRQILLHLDSGSDGLVLWAGGDEAKRGILKQATLQGGGVSKAQRAFAVLPPQDMQIGNHILSNISFVTPVSIQESLPRRHEDGLLPTVLFQRVFISARDHYVVFNPK